MCQAYEGEAAFVRFLEERDRKEGKPDRCNTHAGYIVCDSIRFTEKLDGWECHECGKFYPRRKHDVS